ncbi:hypothetical protein BDP55DRAFT_628708 [Colletotrichum godetiae]|uniref:Uncharacterized protein n=1 Tax=Colletotrichum godetiae TaxID=1209918 RepID=A0AAJ0AS61_9PEZI|nr:uncharacterized protein BDP55DRAFT_628708 [Colletotrichum godetiae]KAK1689384.1 hypothetical protein BDP55DRAFT_628708 [Colletotrichum godetiae]
MQFTQPFVLPRPHRMLSSAPTTMIVACADRYSLALATSSNDIDASILKRVSTGDWSYVALSANHGATGDLHYAIIACSERPYGGHKVEDDRLQKIRKPINAPERAEWEATGILICNRKADRPPKPTLINSRTSCKQLAKRHRGSNVSYETMTIALLPALPGVSSVFLDHEPRGIDDSSGSKYGALQQAIAYHVARPGQKLPSRGEGRRVSFDHRSIAIPCLVPTFLQGGFCSSVRLSSMVLHNGHVRPATGETRAG